MLLPIKGHYYATSSSAHLKYSFNKNHDVPYGLILNKQIWDLNIFRPDIRDNKDFLNELIEGTDVIVLYEKVQYTNKTAKVPRFLIWNDNYFVNVR
jgi:hypothetical protein